MDEYENLSHTKWDCKYPVIFLNAGRKTLYEKLSQHLGGLKSGMNPSPRRRSRAFHRNRRRPHWDCCRKPADRTPGAVHL
jgi:hypothetical protein